MEKRRKTRRKKLLSKREKNANVENGVEIEEDPTKMH
jgi:hypothetical protein